MPILFDRSQAPIFVAVCVGVASEADWLAHLQRMTSVVERAMPYAFVIDTLESNDRPTPKQRRVMADWMRAHDDAIRTFCRGGAFVAQPFIRGVVTAIHWIAPPPYPFSTFARRGDAVEWCRARLAT